MKRWAGIGLVVGLLTSSSCAWLTSSPPAQPDINFAAHTESRGLKIDKMDGSEHGVLELSTTHGGPPQFVLRTSGVMTAALYVKGPVTVVRRAPDLTAPVIGQVDASWANGALRLELKPEGKGPFSFSEFKRISGGASPTALGQPASLLIDLRGTYFANIKDSTGASAGWMRVQVDARWQPDHVYEAMLPSEIDGPLAVAAVAQVDAVLNAVEDAAQNPYIGN